VKSKPEKLWLVIGHRPSTVIRKVSYSTDPRNYDLPDLEPMTDEEYAKVSHRMKVFLAADHAIDFCYDCGLELTQCIGFRLVDDKYAYDVDVSSEVLDIDW
jgi:hypothetical protein